MTMRASLAPQRIAAADAPAPALLDPYGASVILGGFADALPIPVAPAAYTLSGPRGAALLSPDGPLVDHNRGAYYPTAATLTMPCGMAVLGDRLAVADTASSRLVGFAPHARTSHALARSLAGQYGFCDKGDNRWAPVERDSVSWPHAIAACGATAVIADTGNNRVLIWEAA